jgi:hypothetical protein
MCLSKLAYSRRDFLSSKEWRTTHSEEEEENQNQQTNPHTQQNSTTNRTNPCLHFLFHRQNQNLITYKKEKMSATTKSCFHPHWNQNILHQQRIRQHTQHINYRV